MRVTVIITSLSLGAAPGVARAAFEAPPPDLTRLSLEELMNVEVTSVSRKAEPREETAAAIFVITREDLRREGVTNLADALRMVPGVHVARESANRWSVGIRGFGSRLTRGVLVLMDGRSVYTPFFAGTYWETQDTLFNDIERIEVIRGPGGATWGANAFNGVINIITRSAKETHGGYLNLGAGTEERAFGSGRAGFHSGDFHYRAWAKLNVRDAGENPNGPEFDGWETARLGFRTDTDLTSRDVLTVHGDAYFALTGQAPQRPFGEPTAPPRAVPESELGGAHALARWARTLGERSELSLQAWWSLDDRQEATYHERRHTADVEAQHRFSPFGLDDLVWGGGARVSVEEFESDSGLDLKRPGLVDRVFNLFFQEELRLAGGEVRLILGSKFEHNVYSGFEIQPTARALWLADARHTLWGAASRAVRTPSRIDRDVVIEAPIDPQTNTWVRLEGDEGFTSEQVIAFELGHRFRVQPWLFTDVAAFVNLYDDLTSIASDGEVVVEPEAEPPRAVKPTRIANGIEGRGLGGELAVDVQPLSGWQLRGSYSFLDLHLEVSPGEEDLFAAHESQGRGTPKHMVNLRTQHDLPRGFDFDVWARWIDEISAPTQRTDAYTSAGFRVGWRQGQAFRLDLEGHDVLTASHREVGTTNATEVERGFFGRAQWFF